jgi:hypothetical protein
MTAFAELAALGRRLEATRGRLEKREAVVQFLRHLEPAEIPSAVAYLSGRPFPASDPRVLGVRGLPRRPAGGAGAAAEPLTDLDVGAAVGVVAAAGG